LVGFGRHQEVPIIVVGHLLAITDFNDPPIREGPSFGLRQSVSYVEESGIAVVDVPRKLGILIRRLRFWWNSH